MNKAIVFSIPLLALLSAIACVPGTLPEPEYKIKVNGDVTICKYIKVQPCGMAISQCNNKKSYVCAHNVEISTMTK